MRRLLDEGLDELAAGAHEGLPIRVVVGLGVCGAALLLLSAPVVALWAATFLVGEAWGWISTRAQYLHAKGRGAPVTNLQRLNQFADLVFCSAVWFALGFLFWTTGRVEGVICAVTIWLSLMAFGQTYSFQSPVGYLVSGGMPAAGMLATAVFAPHPPGMQMAPIYALLALAVFFAVAGVNETLAARKRFRAAQGSLRASEFDYRMLADNGADVVSRRSADGRRLYISPSIERVLGITPEELLNDNAASYVHPDDMGVFRAALERLEAGDLGQTVDYRCIHRNGSIVWAETSFSRVTDGTDDIVSISRDITQRKQLELELMESAIQAEAAAAAKADFLANMTHELRTPLTAIIGFSDVLRRKGELAGSDARYVGLIHDASATLLSVVNSVLDFSKLEAGGFDPDASPFRAQAMARSMTALVDDQARAKGLTFDLKTDGADDLLLGDAPRLGQVLLNFLSNAIKFTQSGGVEVRVSQSGEGPIRRLRVEVRDSGIGIPEADVGLVFGRFTQADASVSRRFGGTGLGLAIAKRVIEHMGGAIGADSRPGQGSTFWFELDLPVAGAAAAPHEQVMTAAETDDDGRPPRLLVVEDNPVNRELLGVLLGVTGADIHMAVNGVEAIEMMQAMRYDLVLMDVQMPVMDGLTATARIRAFADRDAAATPIVAMTANVLPEQVERCRAAGMNDHIGKPIDPARLFGAIARWTAPRDDDEGHDLAKTDRAAG
ncbi:MAG: multi-sensor hybrid histidine kinase [Caulobacter sp.]|nr:multi-sensor hybrid histidine kinase [Caulobacter sp.]